MSIRSPGLLAAGCRGGCPGIKAAVKKDKLAWMESRLKDVAASLRTCSSRRPWALVRSFAGRKCQQRRQAVMLRSDDDRLLASPEDIAAACEERFLKVFGGHGVLVDGRVSSDQVRFLEPPACASPLSHAEWTEKL